MHRISVVILSASNRSDFAPSTSNLTDTLFVSGSAKGKQVSVVHSAVMVLLAKPSNGS